MMSTQIPKDAEARMRKSVEALQNELSKIRTGRAHPGLLEHVHVDYYGTEVPLNQAANINVEDARTLMVTPWEKSMVPVVEKAIVGSDLGLNPTSAGQVIRVPLPPLTEERRRELSKVVHQEGENAKVAIRNIRRDANHHLKELMKDKELSEDDEHRAETEIQTLTDKYVQRVDELVNSKENELMEI